MKKILKILSCVLLFAHSGAAKAEENSPATIWMKNGPELLSSLSYKDTKGNSVSSLITWIPTEEGGFQFDLNLPIGMSSFTLYGLSRDKSGVSSLNVLSRKIPVESHAEIKINLDESELISTSTISVTDAEGNPWDTVNGPISLLVNLEVLKNVPNHFILRSTKLAPQDISFDLRGEQMRDDIREVFYERIFLFDNVATDYNIGGKGYVNLNLAAIVVAEEVEEQLNFSSQDLNIWQPKIKNFQWKIRGSKASTVKVARNLYNYEFTIHPSYTDKKSKIVTRGSVLSIDSARGLLYLQSGLYNNKPTVYLTDPRPYAIKAPLIIKSTTSISSKRSKIHVQNPYLLDNGSGQDSKKTLDVKVERRFPEKLEWEPVKQSGTQDTGLDFDFSFEKLPLYRVRQFFERNQTKMYCTTSFDSASIQQRVFSKSSGMIHFSIYYFNNRLFSAFSFYEDPKSVTARIRSHRSPTWKDTTLGKTKVKTEKNSLYKFEESVERGENWFYDIELTTVSSDDIEQKWLLESVQLKEYEERFQF